MNGHEAHDIGLQICGRHRRRRPGRAIQGIKKRRPVSFLVYNRLDGGRVAVFPGVAQYVVENHAYWRCRRARPDHNAVGNWGSQCHGLVHAHCVAADAAENCCRQGEQNAAINHAFENRKGALLNGRLRIAERKKLMRYACLSQSR